MTRRQRKDQIPGKQSGAGGDHETEYYAAQPRHDTYESPEQGASPYALDTSWGKNVRDLHDHEPHYTINIMRD